MAAAMSWSISEERDPVPGRRGQPWNRAWAAHVSTGRVGGRVSSFGRGRRGEVRTEAAESPPQCLIRWVMPMLLAGDPTLRTAGRGWELWKPARLRGVLA